MLEARIIAPGGSLFYSADTTPYDLETLWQHIRELVAEHGKEALTLEIVLDDSPGRALVTAWLRHLGAVGIHIRIVQPQYRDHAA